jgi:hypothetical protein
MSRWRYYDGYYGRQAKTVFVSWCHEHHPCRGRQRGGRIRAHVYRLQDDGISALCGWIEVERAVDCEAVEGHVYRPGRVGSTYVGHVRRGAVYAGYRWDRPIGYAALGGNSKLVVERWTTFGTRGGPAVGAAERCGTLFRLDALGTRTPVGYVTPPTAAGIMTGAALLLGWFG